MEKLRLKVQISLAALFNIGIFQWHTICFPVLNCHSCPISVFACPIGIIGQFAQLGLIPLSVIGIMVLAGAIGGRILCGWACPFGLVQDLLYKIPFARFDIPRWTTFIKYAVFVGLVVLVPIYLSTESRLFFCRLCPVATIEAAIPWAIMQGTTNAGGLAFRLGIVVVIFLLAMGHRRIFCKVICPLGASLSVLNRFAAIFPARDSKCIDCGTCSTVCPMETKGEARRFGVYDDRAEECISCLDCEQKCPTSAIRLWG